MKVGTASVNWGFDPLYTWVKTPSFHTMLEQMQQAGYAGTEISYHFPTDVETLKTALQRHGLEAAGTFFAVDLRDATLHDAAVRDALRIAERLLALGSDVLIVSDKPTERRLAIAGRVAEDGSDGLDDARWTALAGGLDRMATALAARGVKTVFHPHVGTYVETRAEIDRLMHECDPAIVGLCPDTGHLAYAGVAVDEVFRDHAARIAYVHLKDVDGATLAHVRSERIGFARAVQLGLFVPLGSGTVDMQAIFGVLRRAGYRGWIVVEQDAPPDPLRAAIENRRFLQRAAGL